MKFRSLTIENYKSFCSKQELILEPGFNLLLGANNAGKTSVLNALDLAVGLNEPHRSESTIPSYGGATQRSSSVSVVVETYLDELLTTFGGQTASIPLDQQVLRDPGWRAINERLEQVPLSGEPIRLHGEFGAERLDLSFYLRDTYVGKSDSSGRGHGFFYNVSSPGATPSGVLASGPMPISTNYFDACRSRVYRFSAQRRPGSSIASQGSADLDREAVALPYCINHLATSDSHGHRLLCEWTERIFPSVKWLEAPPANGFFTLRCLPCRPEARRNDLAIPLSSMGTGIGNVIAMLYVVLNARFPQVIAIDEPNAFLHPRALRELLAILETEGKQHQFIITGHSPDVLTAVRPATIAMLQFDGEATSVKQVDAQRLHQLRGDLADLGIRITDLHAKDRVLWVEGQTEELVFPDLLKHACPEIAAGTAVLRVERTGTFAKKGLPPDEVVSVYERLSQSSALVPPMFCVLLDSENRKPEERADLERRSSEKLRFLPDRMLENYLLQHEAVHALLESFGESVTDQQVAFAIDEAKRGAVVSGKGEVDGAALLGDVISKLTDTKHEFRKTRDVPVLVTWLIQNRPDHLGALATFLREICSLSPTVNTPIR
jgi:hypothetical protein